MELDPADPTRASAQGVRLLLGTSAPQKATISGEITLPSPPPFQGLTVTALTPDALGAGMDPNSLLTQLRNGYQVLTNSTDTVYPYAITDLEPGRYVPVPALMGLTTQGLAVTLLASPFNVVDLSAGEEAKEDFAGVWVDTVDEGPDAGATILNVAFTGDLERHEAELRQVWGGPLCLQTYERTFAELRRIQRELGEEGVGAELGLQTTWSDVDVVDNTVVLGVVVAREDAEAALAERYGEGTVELFPALIPVD